MELSVISTGVILVTAVLNFLEAPAIIRRSMSIAMGVAIGALIL